jgi:hypothetical protein
MRHYFALLTAALFFVSATNPQIRDTGQRVSLTNGNELYTWCQAAQTVLHADANGEVSIKSGARIVDALNAGHCFGYIRGIVDNMPIGGDFSPNPNVKLTQYIDVVFAFLRDHPNVRDRQASLLVERALQEAFSKKQ